MASSLIFQSFTAFGAGLLASLSPCVYPMIPISVGFLGSQSGGSRRPILLFFCGQVLAFALLGVMAVQLGEILGFSHELKSVNLIIGIVLLIFGLMCLTNYFPSMGHSWNKISTRITRRTSDRAVNGWWFPFAVGVGSALLASPCTSPILGSVLMTLSQSETFERGLILMFSYALGMSLLFLALGLGFMHLKRMPRAGRWMNFVHRTSSVLIVSAGAYYVYVGMTHGV
jgi:cytochrome c-type biogenesis protein